ncbi:MAG: Gfo/Idh/MocA family oxidoreductase [Bacteroidetes bacterium]|nr:Gfo/Idh/MocA family oxidoreductase [Bacteroidota bacterium]
MKQVKWGILGCGKIASKFASDLQLVEGASRFAAASLDLKRAGAFASKFGFTNHFGSYEELVQSDVDIIYVATPHGFHFEHVKLCLQHGKSVLCEKAFTLNAKQLEYLIALAKEKNVFLMEAFWTKFLPHYRKTFDLIKQGAVGTIRTVSADFGFKSPEPKPQRLYDPRLGGGSLLDIGIYPVFLTLDLFGEPDQLTAVMNPYSTGVDEQIAISFSYKNGMVASLNSSFAVDTPVEATLNGTTGRIHLANRFHNPSSVVTIHREEKQPEELTVDKEDGFGYQYEARHVQYCLANGLKESPELPLSFSLRLMRLLDRIREACGIRYEADQSF